MADIELSFDEWVAKAGEANKVVTNDLNVFRKACTDYIDYSMNAVEDEIKETVFRLWNKVYKRTPIDTGYARNNWHITGRPSDWVLPFKWVGKGGESKRSYAVEDLEDREYKTVRAIKRSRTGLYYINNNAPYIMMLEAGYSSQGAGFIHASFTEEIDKLKNKLTRLGYVSDNR